MVGRETRMAIGDKSRGAYRVTFAYELGCVCVDRGDGDGDGDGLERPRTREKRIP